MVWTDLVPGTLPADQRPSLGQGQQSDTVVVQHIITKGTIDERIMKALSEKDTTQAALIEAVKADLKI